MAILLGIAHTRLHALHDGHDGLRAALALLSVLEVHTVVNHRLHLTSVLRQDELLALGVIVQSFYFHSIWVVFYCEIIIELSKVQKLMVLKKYA